MKDKKTTCEKVAENIINTHGREKFLYLLNQFSSGATGPSIAKEFGVTRQRVNQWKNKLGKDHVTYVLEPAVEKLLTEKSTSMSMRLPV